MSSQPSEEPQALERTTGRFASFAVAFAFVSVVTGIFSTYGSVLNTSGPLGIWTWPIAVAGQFAVALILGSLAARIPLTGYAYQWVSRLANPVFGWATGWVSFSFLVIVVVAVNYTLASTLLPALLQFDATAMTSLWITIAVLVSQGALVGFSTHWTERVNNVAVVAELLGVIALVVLLFAVAAWTGNLHLGNLVSRGELPTEGYWSIGGATSVGPWLLAFLLGAFTIVGFESAANLAEETREPAVVVPRAMARAVLASGILGMLFLMAVTAAADDISALTQSSTPVADVIRGVLGSWIGTALLILVLLAVFACGLVILMTGTRLVWAMARDNRFPGWQTLHKLSPRFRTPLNAAAFITVVAMVILVVFSANTDVLFILFAAGTLLPALIYVATVALYLVKRRHLPVSQGFRLGRWETPVLGMAVVWLVFEMSIFRDASFFVPWMYVLVMFAIGGIYLCYLLVTRGVKGLAMPEMTSIDNELGSAAHRAPES